MSLALISHLLQSYGYLAVFGFVALESVGIPLPGETALIAAALSGRYRTRAAGCRHGSLAATDAGTRINLGLPIADSARSIAEAIDQRTARILSNSVAAHIGDSPGQRGPSGGAGFSCHLFPWAVLGEGPLDVLTVVVSTPPGGRGTGERCGGQAAVN